MKKKLCLMLSLLFIFYCCALVNVNAATYSKTKTASVSYNSQCTGKITDKATVNSSSLDWSFSLSGTTTSSNNGYTFGSPYTSSTTYSNARKTATHKVGYYFYNSSGNHVGGNTKTFTFNYSGSSIS